MAVGGDGREDASGRSGRGIAGRLAWAWRRHARPWLAGGRVVVEPYLGYGRGRAVRARGRVLVDPGVAPAEPGQPALATLRAVWRRLRSAEIPFARVEVALTAESPDAPRARARAIADEEGYLDVRLVADRPLPPGWHALRFRLVDPAPRGAARGAATGHALVPAADAPFGVVSDLDDTVLITGATRLRELLVRSLLHDVHERELVPGAPELYRALTEGGAPLIYVSSSPWNLHAPLQRLLALHGMPRGPLILRDWGLGGERGHAGHKRREIEAVLDDLPGTAFVLLGDTGQQDPGIYAQLAERRPERVAGVLLRHVGDERRAAEVRALGERAQVPFHLVPDLGAAARLAEAHGWIDAAGRRACEAAVRDAVPPTERPGRRG